MRILVDHQIFLAQKYGGISNYHSIIHRLINEMPSGHQSTILTLGSNNKYIKTRLGLLKLLNIHGKRVLRSINRRAMEWMISKYDVFHPSYYDTYFLKAAKIPPFVLTVHDVIPERYFTDAHHLAMINNKKELIYKAAKIIAISETTKKSLLEFYQVDAAAIEVIPHGRPDYFGGFTRGKDQGARPEDPAYILFVGLRSFYKNFNFFLESIAAFLIRNRMQLKVVGPPPTIEEMALVEQLHLSSLVFFHTHPSVEDLFHFYNQAFCFAFPSLEEGFGLPLLEAATADCPVLCSDIPVFHEVAGDSALYFDPLSKEHLPEQLEKLRTDPPLRAELIARGRNNLLHFSWQTAAEKTLAVYHMAAGTL